MEAEGRRREGAQGGAGGAGDAFVRARRRAREGVRRRDAGHARGDHAPVRPARHRDRDARRADVGDRGKGRRQSRRERRRTCERPDQRVHERRRHRQVRPRRRAGHARGGAEVRQRPSRGLCQGRHEEPHAGRRRRLRAGAEPSPGEVLGSGGVRRGHGGRQDGVLRPRHPRQGRGAPRQDGREDPVNAPRHRERGDAELRGEFHPVSAGRDLQRIFRRGTGRRHGHLHRGRRVETRGRREADERVPRRRARVCGASDEGKRAAAP